MNVCFLLSFSTGNYLNLLNQQDKFHFITILESGILVILMVVDSCTNEDGTKKLYGTQY